jgi:hypothetical protein
MDQDSLDLAIPDDGEFFCEIRKHQGFSGDVNHEAERAWLQRLAAASASRRAHFDQLLSHQGYLDALTALLQAGLHGLFTGFRLQKMREVMDSGTEEVGLLDSSIFRGPAHRLAGIGLPPYAHPPLLGGRLRRRRGLDEPLE